jgi:hypothetical protein
LSSHGDHVNRYDIGWNRVQALKPQNSVGISVVNGDVINPCLVAAGYMLERDFKICYEVFAMIRLVALVLLIGLFTRTASPVSAACDPNAMYTLVAVNANGEPANGSIDMSSMTPDGHYVAYSSLATNLVPGDTNNRSDIFLYDRMTCQTTLVSVASDETPLNGNSWFPSISDDGKYVAFLSNSDDLSGNEKIFIRDLQAGETIIVNGVGGATPNNAISISDISANGNLVVFTSEATNILPGDTNDLWDVFVYNRELGQTLLVSVSPEGDFGNERSASGNITPDGRYVLFTSNASNLVPDDEIGSDTFIRDLQTNTTERIEVLGGTGRYLSDDARYITFGTSSPNFVSDDFNGIPDVFIYDRVTEIIRRVSIGSDGSEGTEIGSYGGGLSSDNRYVLFQSWATNFTFNRHPGGSITSFVHDLNTRKTYAIPIDDNDNIIPTSPMGISGDGSLLLLSTAYSLIPYYPPTGLERLYLMRWQQTPNLDFQSENLLRNGHFGQGMANWGTYANLNYTISNGAIRFGDNPQGAVLLQNTEQPIAANTPLELQFFWSNTLTVRKRMLVLLHSDDFSDLTACSFWLNPGRNTYRHRFVIQAHTTKPWNSAVVSFYPSGELGSTVALDNVMLRVNPNLNAEETHCGSGQAWAGSGVDGPELLQNGSFDSPIGNPIGNWGNYGQIASRLTNGVLEFYRLPGQPTGTVLQYTSAGVPPNERFELQLDLGNSSSVRQRVTVLVHNWNFSDSQVCVFWLEPNTPLQRYTMRNIPTGYWSRATVSVYGSTPTNQAWLQMDNVSLRNRPSASMMGTDCYEPGATPADALALERAPALEVPITMLPPGELPLMATPLPLEPQNETTGEGQMTESELGGG